MKHSDSVPLIIKVLPHVVLAIIRKQLLDVILGLLPGTSRRAFEEVVRAIFAACACHVAFSTEIITALVATRTAWIDVSVIITKEVAVG